MSPAAFPSPRSSNCSSWLSSRSRRLDAVYVYWKLDRRRGAGLFAVSMGAAFLFGYLLHFVIDSPDLHSNVTGRHRDMFFHSALGLALTEFLGFSFGAYFAARGTR